MKIEAATRLKVHAADINMKAFAKKNKLRYSDDDGVHSLRFPTLTIKGESAEPSLSGNSKDGQWMFDLWDADDEPMYSTSAPLKPLAEMGPVIEKVCKHFKIAPAPYLKAVKSLLAEK